MLSRDTRIWGLLGVYGFLAAGDRGPVVGPVRKVLRPVAFVGAGDGDDLGLQ